MKNNIQLALVRNYENRTGLINSSQIDKELYFRWVVLIHEIYEQALELNTESWNNPSELKVVSRDNLIWYSLKNIFRDMIGFVNGHPLMMSEDIICIIIAYSIRKNNQYESEERFRVKFEYYLARQIIHQLNSSSQIIEDEQIDRRIVRRLRKHNKNNIIETNNNIKNSSELLWNTSTVLYIYKGNIRCHRYSHNITQATATIYDKDDRKIELNVEYCKECKKYLLEYSVFEEYRNRFGILIGNFRMVTNGQFDGDYSIAQESSLMLTGYNVSQRDGYTTNERHYILARLIYDRIMSKGEIIRYLSYFIRKNGAKQGNELAVKKWKDDLAFVQDYNKDTQPRIIITKIKKY